MESTQNKVTKTDLSILKDFQHFLTEIWKDGQRDWKVYSTSKQTHNWDIRTVEPRK